MSYPPPGYPPQPPPGPKKRSPWLYGCLGCGGAAVLMLIVGVGCVAIIGTEVDAPTPKDPGAAAAKPAEGDAKKDDKLKSAKIGDSVESGSFAFTVTDVETGIASVQDDSGFVTTDADGEYVIVHVTVKNIGDDSGLFESSSQKLHDKDGKEYSSDTEAELTKGADAFLNEVNPGNEVKGQLIYDVPKGMKPASIELHDFLSLDSGAEVDLS